MTTAYDVLGLIGSSITSAALIPLLLKVFRNRSARDISYSYLCMYITGVSCITIYGVGEALWPIYIPGLLELLCVVWLLALKVWYGRRLPIEDSEKRSVSGSSDKGHTGSCNVIA